MKGEERREEWGYFGAVQNVEVSVAPGSGLYVGGVTAGAYIYQ